MLGISPRKIQYRIKEYAEEDRKAEQDDGALKNENGTAR
jgi:hypothetical protein